MQSSDDDKSNRQLTYYAGTALGYQLTTKNRWFINPDLQIGYYFLPESHYMLDKATINVKHSDILEYGASIRTGLTIGNNNMSLTP